MIVNAIISLFLSLWSFVVGWLPDMAVLPDSAQTVVTFFRFAIALMLDLAPFMSTFLTVAVFVVVFEFALFIWGFIKWIISVIRG